jgi:hypothetical protein
VLRLRLKRQRLSVAAASAYTADRSDARVVFWTRVGPNDGDSLVALRGSRRHELGGANVALIWDGAPRGVSPTSTSHCLRCSAPWRR